MTPKSSVKSTGIHLKLECTEGQPLSFICRNNRSH
uniref:Uncharacterized protein n=1 Tax=Anguilla anguilla TaxID=7936 RepID=A0A0E9VZ15_ANGAN